MFFVLYFRNLAPRNNFGISFNSCSFFLCISTIPTFPKLFDKNYSGISCQTPLHFTIMRNIMTINSNISSNKPEVSL